MKEMYYNLMKQGFSINEIDEMEIGWYFEVMEHANKKESFKEQPKTFIDQLW